MIKLYNSYDLQKKQVVFIESQISDITEILADCSSKWKEIGTALGIPDNEIKNIMAMMHMYTPIMCLKEVLCGWVMCKFSTTKPPTLEVLENALQSKVVGLGCEASLFQEKLQCLLFEITQLAPKKSRKCELEIIRQTQN